MAAMLTTEDNPFDPRLDFWAWYQWDIEQGYNTCAYLARVAMAADEVPQEVIDRQIEQAIDEIIEMHSNGIYKKLEIEEAA